jgi:hypothetical protein
MAGRAAAAVQYIDPANVSATASSVNYQLEAIYSCNGNGLTGDLHTNNIGGEPPAAGQGTMWLAEGTSTDPTPWIKYEFDKTYSLQTMWVWNYNQVTSSGGDRTTRGMKDCTIEYSVDGTNFTQLGATHTFNRADASAAYAHNTEIDFGGVSAKYVRITAMPDPAGNWGGGYPGLSEVRFYAGDQVGFETAASAGPEAASPALVNVVLTSAQAQGVTVDYSVSGGTAIGGGTDYTLAGSSLTFAAGQTVRAISIDIVDDGLDENDETIILALSNPTGGVELGTAQHIYTILDPRPSAGFETGSSSAAENAQIIHRPRRIPVSLSAVSTGPVTLDYSVAGGSASRGIDYIIEGTSLSFDAGQTSKDILVTINDDSLQESDETIIIGLSNIAGAKAGTYTQHTHTILDNDTGEPVNRDLNNDGSTNNLDLIILLESWLECTLEPPELCWQ